MAEGGVAMIEHTTAGFFGPPIRKIVIGDVIAAAALTAAVALSGTG